MATAPAVDRLRPAAPRVTAPRPVASGRPRVLIVDDDRGLLGLLRLIFNDAGFDARTCVDGRAALDAVQTEAIPDVIVLDLEMPVMNGRDCFREIRGRGIAAPVMILSAFGARSAQIELGAEAHLSKPFEPEDLVHAVQNLLA